MFLGGEHLIPGSAREVTEQEATTLVDATCGNWYYSLQLQ
jgi:hypothetical protein